MKTILARFGVGRLGVAATAMSIALLLRGAILAIYLVSITRWLGVERYGVFSAAVAVSAILAPAAGWGAAQLLMQRVSARPGLLDAELRAAVWQVIAVGVALMVISLVAAQLLGVDMNIASLIAVGTSDLILLPMTLLVATACQSVGNTRIAAVAICLPSLMRLLLLGGAIATGIEPSPAAAAFIHLAGVLLSAVACLGMLHTCPRPDTARPRIQAKSVRVVHSTRYALGNVAAWVYLEVDKLLIFALVGSSGLGSYVVAFRVAMLAGMPLAGLSSVVLPRLFAMRGPSQRAATEHAMLIASAGYGAVATAVLALAAPWLSVVFGDDFGDASHYLLLLSPWPILYACKVALATQLTGAGKQGVRTVIEGGGVLVVILAGWAMIASHGPAGATIALLVAEAAMVIAMALHRRFWR